MDKNKKETEPGQSIAGRTWSQPGAFSMDLASIVSTTVIRELSMWICPCSSERDLEIFVFLNLC